MIYKYGFLPSEPYAHWISSSAVLALRLEPSWFEVFILERLSWVVGDFCDILGDGFWSFAGE
jgi:hypothetical protein